MDTEKMLDDVYHTFISHLEEVFLKKGASWVNTSISDFAKQDLADMLWEIEDDHGRPLTNEETLQCFQDAINYIDDLYSVRDLQALEDYAV